jgi:hypothetical protein
MEIRLAEKLCGANEEAFLSGARVDLTGEEFEVLEVGEDRQTLQLKPMGPLGWDAPNNMPRFTTESL